jgi:hypothetical protein
MPTYRIVATPEELTARGGWWPKGQQAQPDVTGIDWLAKPKRMTLAQIAPRPRWMQGAAHSNGSYNAGPDWSRTPHPPTLAGESTRLAKAVLGPDTYSDFYHAGPRAAEAYITFRRAQLGLPTTVEE